MLSPLSRGIAGLAAFAMVTGPTMAGAAVPAQPIQQVNPWAALSVLSGGASAVAYCGAAVASAAQAPGAGCVLPQVDAPLPPPQTGGPIIDQPIPPPLPGAAEGIGFNPLFIALGAAALAAIAYFVIKGSNNNSNSPA